MPSTVASVANGLPQIALRFDEIRARFYRLLETLANQKQKIRSYDSYPLLVLKLCDSLAIVFGLIILLSLAPNSNSRSTIIVGLLAIGIFGWTAELLGVYRNWRGIAFAREATCTTIAWVLTFIALAAIGRFTEYSSEIHGSGLLFWTLASPLISLLFRWIYRLATKWMIRRGIRTRKFAILGLNPLGEQLYESIANSPDLGYEFVGYFDDRDDRRDDATGQKIGRTSELVEQTKKGGVQAVFITIPMRAEERIRDFITELSDTTASVYIVPDLFVFQLLHSRWSEFQGLPVVSIFENPFYGIDGALKRSVDVVLASLFLLIGFVPMAIIGLLVKLSSSGPVFFRQSRYGLDGREIKVWKFRTMTCCDDGADVKQATANDRRVTKIGAILRKTSLDETPQLINVLLGNMSLVGPRPHATAHNEYYRKEIEGYMLRHKVKPGITGLAQVKGYRGETETLDKMEKRVFFDHQYIRSWSIWLDVKILFQTIGIVFRQQNAY